MKDQKAPCGNHQSVEHPGNEQNERSEQRHPKYLLYRVCFPAQRGFQLQFPVAENNGGQSVHWKPTKNGI